MTTRTLFLLVLTLPANANAQASKLQVRLQAMLDSVVVAQQLPGATAAVSMDGKLVIVASGLADVERGARMTPTSRMMVGSSAKPFFAYVAMSLAGEAKVDLDVPVSRWLGREPWFARLPNASRFTLRQLLTHRTGIANHAGDSAFAALVRNATTEQRQRGFSAAEQIAIVLDRPAPFRAGEQFLYTDTGYLVAALALERAIGRTYYQELQARVLSRLHLEHTSPSDHADLPGLVQGYIAAPPDGSAPKGFAAWGLPDKVVADGKLVINPAYEWTGGGLISTSGDLAEWMEALFERPSLKQVSDAMVIVPPGAPYGLGIFVRTTPAAPLYFHPGGFPGYHTEVAYSPFFEVGIAFQANTDRVDGQAVMRAMLAVVEAEGS